MFTSISGPELLILLVLGLLLFGPRKLPQMGRTVGKAFAEFRKATKKPIAALSNLFLISSRCSRSDILPSGLAAVGLIVAP